MMQRFARQLALLLILGAIASGAHAETISRIRVMLHPYAAAPGELPTPANARLQTIAGVPLTLAGKTRTGGLEFTLAQPLDADAATALGAAPAQRSQRALGRDREHRRVDQQQAPQPPIPTHCPARSSWFGSPPPRLPNWAVLLPRWSSLVGSSVSVDHQIGDVWVLTLASPGARRHPRQHGLAARDRRRGPVRGSGPPRARPACSERSELSAAMVAQRSGRRHQRRGGVGPANRKPAADGGRDRYRHHRSIPSSRARSCPATTSSPIPTRPTMATAATTIRRIRATAPATMSAAPACRAKRAPGMARSSAA